MLTLFHISDLHFGPPYYPEIGEKVRAFAHELEPDIIVASGDFTQRAREEQFRAARNYLDRLPQVPIVVTPGNHDVPLHDVWRRMTDPFGRYREYINPDLDTVTRLPGLVVVALNSTAPRRAIVNGRISRRQLAYARRAFEETPEGDLRVIVSHHHFAPPPDFEGADVMPKAKRALDALTSMNVDLILGGHLHRGYIGNSLDVYSGANREYGIVIAQSGTTTSRRGRAREREKNSFNVIRMDDHVIRVTHYMHFEDADGFLPTSRHIFFRGGRLRHQAEAAAAVSDHNRGYHVNVRLQA